MRRIVWRRVLPVAQLTFALACHIYEPHQYRVRAKLDRAVSNMDYTFQESPAPIGRVSLGINFPAMVLAFPLRNEDRPLYRHNCDYTLIWISVRDIGVFTGIVLFWYCIGWILDEQASPPGSWRRSARICGWCVGVVLGFLTGIYALSLLVSESLSQRQIGMAGIAWAILLIPFCTWRAAIQVRLLTGVRSGLN